MTVAGSGAASTPMLLMRNSGVGPVPMEVNTALVRLVNVDGNAKVSNAPPLKTMVVDTVPPPDRNPSTAIPVEGPKFKREPAEKKFRLNGAPPIWVSVRIDCKFAFTKAGEVWLAMGARIGSHRNRVGSAGLPVKWKPCVFTAAPRLAHPPAVRSEKFSIPASTRLLSAPRTNKIVSSICFSMVSIFLRIKSLSGIPRIRECANPKKKGSPGGAV